MIQGFLYIGRNLSLFPTAPMGSLMFEFRLAFTDSMKQQITGCLLLSNQHIKTATGLSHRNIYRSILAINAGILATFLLCLFLITNGGSSVLLLPLFSVLSFFVDPAPQRLTPFKGRSDFSQRRHPSAVWQSGGVDRVQSGPGR